MIKKKKYRQIKNRNILLALAFLELIIFLVLLFTAIIPYTNVVLAGVGQDNVSVTTLLDVGNVFPEILNISINNDAVGVDLTPNSTAKVTVHVIARDYNGEANIDNITVRFFDVSSSSYGAADDNNNHYTNDSCVINSSYGDEYEVNSSCTFDVWYYANNATWNASAIVTDNNTLSDSGNESIVVNTLLALLLPDTLNYGTVNATEVSEENQTNVTNVGNVQLNLSLSGYGAAEGDGLAMNCSLGTVQNISVGYEKYNLTGPNTGTMNFTHFTGNYTNLTASPVVNQFDLNFRQNDTNQYVDDTNSTYWRIYVPVGVAGSCTGNIIFGAVQSPAA